MGLHKGLDKYVDLTGLPPGPIIGPWQCPFPNTADFNFDYGKLLSIAAQTALAENQNPNTRVAIVGMGVAGLLAARELFRCGYTNIDMFEATDRIGGRNYSIPATNQYTTFEMGAMRMPFFTTPGSKHSVLDYYCTEFGITTQDFPDPGSKAVTQTGIYINNGLGPDPNNPYPQPKLDIWFSGKNPPNQLLQQILMKWKNFSDMVTEAAQSCYGTAQWEDFWHSVVRNYWTMNFRELVYMPAISKYDPAVPGFFGGLGMSDLEAWNFYVIGAGDGGWGAFYDISCLFPIRTLLFGFATNHQLVQGRFDSDGNFAPGHQYNQPTFDSLQQQIMSPNYLGLQSLAESLFYEPVTSPFVPNISLYQAVQTLPGIQLFTKTPVTALTYSGPGVITLSSRNFSDYYNVVIVTPSTWGLEMSTVLEGFDYSVLPYEATIGLKESHWITSCKVFYPLKQRYWEQSQIPQVINTDTFLQDVYGIAVTVGSREDPGVLLVSYTWEDDASKLEADADDAKLAAKCLAELDRILMQCTNIQQPISPFVDTSQPVVIHWERQPTYRGCAKLYRERSWNIDYALLTYNQQYSASSGLYFAGEGYSVEGGWTEPALRLGLDAVLHAIRNTGGTFQNGFDFEHDYPKYDTQWRPDGPC